MLLGVIAAAANPVTSAPESAAASTEGADIYRRGVLPGGEALRGDRAGAPEIAGAAAACANCHGRSGLGGLEGGTAVPPVTGRFLYRARRLPTAGNTSPPDMGPGERLAYTDATLVRAIRNGMAPDGHPLAYLMPHYQLGDPEMAALIAYLKPLSSRPSPGVGDTTLEFATVITPEADPLRRQAMLAVLEQFFGRENVFTGATSQPPQWSHRFSPGIHRWQLHVWQLSGAPNSWEAQLDERLQREPVFALLSGVGGRNWEPVHRFCQRAELPCLFPNIDRPVLAEQDFYDVYLSKGVLLEAQLIAARLREQTRGAATTNRIVQIYRQGDIGVDAAAQLRAALSASSAQVLDRVVESDATPKQVQAVISGTGPDDVLILWIRPRDIPSLPSEPPAARAVFLSGLMAGLERALLPAAWREVARMTYPLELPERRGVSMDYPFSWMRLKHIALTDERIQTDTYLACVITAETLSMMGENLLRDDLLDMLEMHLSSRIVNGAYPRLGLGTGQRFASKGGYLVRFAGPQGSRIIADGGWSVP